MLILDLTSTLAKTSPKHQNTTENKNDQINFQIVTCWEALPRRPLRISPRMAGAVRTGCHRFASSPTLFTIIGTIGWGTFSLTFGYFFSHYAYYTRINMYQGGIVHDTASAIDTQWIPCDTLLINTDAIHGARAIQV